MNLLARILAPLTCAASALGAAHATTPDEALVRDIPHQIARGWSKGDGDAIAAVYAADGVLVAGHGVVLHGPTHIASYHDEQLAGSLKDSQLTIEITSVRFLEPDIVLMQTEGGILWPGQTQLAPGNRGIQSFVVVKKDGAWRVSLFQNTRILQRAPD
jgi:uncharacterized protein (TIGR02246 family)